jgi:hypothetical protein
LVKRIASICPQGFQRNVFHIFLSFLIFITIFLNLNEFPKI